MTRRHSPYPPETKQIAIELAAGTSTHEAARQTGLPQTSISRWVRENPGVAARLAQEKRDDMTAAIAAHELTSRLNQAIQSAPDAKQIQALAVAWGIVMDKLERHAAGAAPAIPAVFREVSQLSVTEARERLAAIEQTATGAGPKAGGATDRA